MSKNFRNEIMKKNIESKTFSQQVDTTEPNMLPEENEVPVEITKESKNPNESNTKKPEAKEKKNPTPKKQPEPESEKTEPEYKPTTIGLIPAHDKFLRFRSKQLGIPLYEYQNILISEERERKDTNNPEDLFTYCEGKYREKKTRTNFIIEIENYAFLSRYAALCGISNVEYANYIIEQEIEREKKEGKRKGKFDE